MSWEEVERPHVQILGRCEMLSYVYVSKRYAFVDDDDLVERS